MNRNQTIKSLNIRSYGEDDIETIITKHRVLYETEYGFAKEFGDYVEKYLLLFHQSNDPDKGVMWIAEEDGEFAGVLAAVKADEETVQLRWFLVEPGMRGKGVGNLLMKTALDYCENKKVKKAMLWTVSILEAARHLYRKYGFSLTQTKHNETWGDNLTEERWDLELK